MEFIKNVIAKFIRFLKWCLTGKEPSASKLVSAGQKASHLSVLTTQFIEHELHGWSPATDAARELKADIERSLWRLEERYEGMGLDDETYRQKMHDEIYTACARAYIDFGQIMDYDEPIPGLVDKRFKDALFSWSIRGEYNSSSKYSKQKSKFQAHIADKLNNHVYPEWFIDTSLLRSAKKGIGFDRKELVFIDDDDGLLRKRWSDIDSLRFEKNELRVNHRASCSVFNKEFEYILERLCFYFRQIEASPGNELRRSLNIDMSTLKKYM